MKTVVIIIVVVAGGLLVALYAAPNDGTLDTSSSSPASRESLLVDNDGEIATNGTAPETEEGQHVPDVGIAIGDRAADFTLESFDGQTATLSSFRGRPVLIDFWAGWCPFCVQELPAIEEAHQRHGDDLVVLGVHRTNTESVATGAAFAEDRGVTYMLLKDSDGSVYRHYSGGQNFMPMAYYIDRNGIIRNRVLGPKSPEKIQSDVQALLAQ